jgi:3-methyladenine DNA glycosylase AlkC
MSASRKGARSLAAIDPEVLQALNAGRMESATLSESLAVDQSALLQAVAPFVPAGRAAALREAGIVRRMALAAELLLEHLAPAELPQLHLHPSDTVRGWAAFVVASQPGLDLAGRLKSIEPLADDPHFGVREWAWLALRPRLAAELDLALRLLRPWSRRTSENLRRFASEATRPRGVWCAHIAELRANPARGLPILEPLHSDPSRYVQDSVANWLNDASKDDPDWVRQVCRDWSRRSGTDATRRICQRALRTTGGG